MDSSRRVFLGTAALSAGGLMTLTSAAVADDKGQPGQGGFGRDVQPLPPGATVAYHDPKDVGAMPDFVRSLDGSKPKITSGGWAKEIDRAPAADHERARRGSHVPRSWRIA